MADKGSVATGVVERLAFGALRRLNVDSTGRLRVGDCTVTSGTITTVSTVTNISQLGGFNVKPAFLETQDYNVWANCVRNRIQ